MSSCKNIGFANQNTTAEVERSIVSTIVDTSLPRELTICSFFTSNNSTPCWLDDIQSTITTIYTWTLPLYSVKFGKMPACTATANTIAKITAHFILDSSCTILSKMRKFLPYLYIGKGYLQNKYMMQSISFWVYFKLHGGVFCFQTFGFNDKLYAHFCCNKQVPRKVWRC